MISLYAERNMNIAIDDLVEYFLVRVGGRRKQILTEAICNPISGITSHVEHGSVDSSDSSDRMREFNAAFVKYWNAKVMEHGLNNMIRFRSFEFQDVETKGRNEETAN